MRQGPVITAKTVIGMVVGAVIISIGLASFLLDLGLQDVEIDEEFAAGEHTSYRFSAEAGAAQRLLVVADLFEVEASSPGEGMQIPPTTYRERESFEWIHEEGGESIVHVRNKGQSDMAIVGAAQVSTDPIFFTYHVLVMISGVVIMGFSAAFSMRKPRGF